jgi:hypothetical protein
MHNTHVSEVDIHNKRGSTIPSNIFGYTRKEVNLPLLALSAEQATEVAAATQKPIFMFSHQLHVSSRIVFMLTLGHPGL